MQRCRHCETPWQNKRQTVYLFRELSIKLKNLHKTKLKGHSTNEVFKCLFNRAT
jgi:hypothetical protein